MPPSFPFIFHHYLSFPAKTFEAAPLRVPEQCERGDPSNVPQTRTTPIETRRALGRRLERYGGWVVRCRGGGITGCADSEEGGRGGGERGEGKTVGEGEGEEGEDEGEVMVCPFLSLV